MAGIALSDNEVWRFLAAQEVGVLTTLRADGSPVSVPVWFLAFDRKVYVAGPSATAKFRRVTRDPRVAFLVETGRRWVELEAVHLNGRARVVPDPDWEDLDRGFDAKYAGLRAHPAEQPTSVRRRYAHRSLLEIRPERIASWNNARLRRPGR